MSIEHEKPGHGHSPAAWTAVVIMLIGIITGAVFFWLQNPTMVYASAGVIAFGLIVGGIMKAAGYGVNGPKYTPKPAEH